MGCCGVLHIPSKFPYSSSSSSNPSTPPLIHSLFGSSLNRTSSSINSFQLPNIRRRRSLICFSHPKAREVSSDSDKKEEKKNAEKEEDIVVTENQESSIGIGRRSSSSENKVIGIGRGLFSVFIPTILKQEENDEKGGDGNLGIVGACLVGLLTGVAVVIFNNAVHEIRDLFWDGIPSRGASWLREEPIQDNWKQVILVPTCGGVMVSLLNTIGASLQEETPSPSPPQSLISNLKGSLRSVLKAVAASVTLGTGNSLGPEGPSVEIGASIAKGVAHLFDTSNQTKLSLSLIAAGSAAGISSGFNAAVAGCFFAVESVLWPSPVESSPSLTNITSMVILSAVIASVVSEVGLGSEPAFKVPEYDFRSPSELPLYLLLGILCGLVSLTLSRCTAYTLQVADNIHKAIGIPKFLFPVMGGLAVGLIALSYPEILYWGFENVDILLESRPFVKGLPGNLLLQLVGVKILATSLCRASGLVGGYYAPSLFIGAATGMAYGKFLSYSISQSDPIFHFSFLEVASPQAYGLVGMAATLAGVCQVPLTAVLLLFELTQDYRILLPLLGAVGLSSLIASGQTRKRGVRDKIASLGSKNGDSQDPKRSFLYLSVPSSRTSSLTSEASDFSDLCELESSLCVDDSFTESRKLEERIFVRQAMQTRYVTVKMSTSLTEAVNLMLAEKQSGALIVDDDNFLIGLVTLGDIEQCCRLSTKVEKRFVSEICQMNSEQCRILTTATPDMSLLSARSIMDRQGLDQLPVVLEQTEHHIGFLVGLLDKICIDLTCRAVATQELLSLYSKPRKQKDKE